MSASAATICEKWSESRGCDAAAAGTVGNRHRKQSEGWRAAVDAPPRRLRDIRMQ